MSTKIGHFEILSELAKSESGCVYKATDQESSQIVALKTIRLEAYGEHADELVRRILKEAESTKDLNSPNIPLVYGAGEIEGQFCATMDYIQGNSIATMLARKEGFSIWDLLDISRQVCQGLDHAHQHNVFHYSLEPAKIMVTWDGTVKILSFGISSTGFFVAGATGDAIASLYYMSPEQVSGDPMDSRSNLFTWGAMLYEMVTDEKAFPGTDSDEVRRNIVEITPPPPVQVNPRTNSVASDVIMKALAKDPAHRYQSGREMATDLERCRENTGKTVKKAGPAKGTMLLDKAKAPAAAKLAAPPAQRPAAPPPAPKFETKPVENKCTQPASPQLEELDTSWSVPAPPQKPGASKATAAAAGWNSAGSSASRGPLPDPSAQFVSSVVKASIQSLEKQNASMSSAVLDEPAAEQPKIAVDPMMAEGAGAERQGTSFSDLAEMPPLKEVYVAQPGPNEDASEEEQLHPSIVLRRSEPEKPKIQPREVAEKAIKEIKSVPPQLLMYSIAAAVALILVIGVYVLWSAHSQNTDEEGATPFPVAASAQTAPAPQPAPEQPQAVAPESAPAEAEAPEPAEEPAPRMAVAKTHGKNRKAASATRAAIPGQLLVDSTPEGAQFQVDGQSDPSWLTPFTLTNLAPGQHKLTVSKSGFGAETRTAEVASASRASLLVHLNALMATATVTSDPSGAAIFVDGKDTLHVTPSQITLEKGSHTVLVRKAGFLDETISATGQPGQNLHFAPTLRALGNADDLKTVGRFKKIFGGGATAGMSKVNVKTTPKGAQIAVNRRMVEKTTPVEFLLNPGNYIVDITLSGYKPVQKLITVEQGNNVAIDETFEPQ